MSRQSSIDGKEPTSLVVAESQIKIKMKTKIRKKIKSRIAPQGQDTAEGLPASVRRFGASSCDLHAIAAWPAECERTIGVPSFFPSLTVQPFAPRSGPGTSSLSNLPRPLSGQEFRDREDKKHCWEGPWEALPLWGPGRGSG